MVTDNTSYKAARHTCQRTYILPGFVFFFRRLISELAERNSTKIGHVLGSNCDLKMHVQNLGIASPTNRRSKNHLFGPTSQLNGNFNGLYLRNKTRYIGQVRWQLQGMSYIAPKCHELWSINGLKLDLHFYPPTRKFCILLYCQALQTEISRRNSTILCQSADGKLR